MGNGILGGKSSGLWAEVMDFIMPILIIIFVEITA